MRFFAKTTLQLGLVSLVSGALCATPVLAQAAVSSSDAFNFPEDISFIARQDNPNDRSATARVNGNIITGTEIDDRVALILSAQPDVQLSQEDMQGLRLQVLRNLIDETLQVQEAAAQDMPVTEEEVKSAYERFAREGRGMSPEELDAYLRSVGSSPNSIKRQIQGELAWDRLLRRNVAPFVNVSEGEVTELKERLEASRGTTEYRLGEIFLAATPANSEQVLANAQQIVQQLREGGSFVAYARQYSQASSAIVGGDLGWIRLEQLQNAQLETAAAQMSPGQLVGPLQIPGGYSILLMIDQRQIGMADPRDAVLSLKQISIDWPEGLSDAEIEQRGNAFMQEVQSFQGCGDADARAAALGATTVDNDEIAVRALPEQLQPILLNLNVGQTTPPFGVLEEGIRVLMLCGRDDPAEAVGPTTDQLMAQMEDERINRRAQRYLRDLRRDAVIEYN
ncbi:peptidylprolyl isomerase [Aurantiacibacter spongiae]|uniref:peptidylprolyl isomerase n=1 Tax=Aurantiacibacter spongiae TaxID=2488860 RepID=UPI001F3D73DA|nr:peptidylprolyl isomerase [Aurantiacibacter spongiae]